MISSSVEGSCDPVTIGLLASDTKRHISNEPSLPCGLTIPRGRVLSIPRRTAREARLSKNELILVWHLPEHRVAGAPQVESGGGGGKIGWNVYGWGLY